MRTLIVYLIDMIRIEKLVMIGHTQKIEVECTPRDRVFGVELLRLGLNLIV